MINDDRINMKRDDVRIIRIILDLHGVIVDSRKVVLFEYENWWRCDLKYGNKMNTRCSNVHNSADV